MPLEQKYGSYGNAGKKTKKCLLTLSVLIYCFTVLGAVPMERMKT
jgi:hypothetical protein